MTHISETIAVHEHVRTLAIEIQDTENHHQPIGDNQPKSECEEDLVLADGCLKEFKHVGGVGNDFGKQSEP
jgi:hypothetical protein